MDYKKRRRIRQNLVVKQKHRCCYCVRVFGPKGSPLEATIEHLRPLADGGSSRLKNLAAACRHCNQHRGCQMQASRLARAYILTAVPLAETISMEPVSPTTS
ncbi:HNH endonuclease [Erythrobacter longus]|uniref:HNH endonuclease n=1 Tax=Erythrobacter longus TaxID=1044 RepID=UPI0009DD94F9